MLLQENEDLGKLIASGRTARLEGEIALEKTLVQEMKKNQAGELARKARKKKESKVSQKFCNILVT